MTLLAELFDKDFPNKKKYQCKCGRVKLPYKSKMLSVCEKCGTEVEYKIKR